MNTPDPDAFVGNLVVAAAAVEALDLTDDATLDQLASRLADLRCVAAIVRAAIAEVETAIPLDMEADVVTTSRFQVIREPQVRSTWKPSGAETMRDDIRAAVIRRFATDPETGEINQGQRNLLTMAIADLWEGVPSFDTIKVAARKRWGLRMSDYREYTNGWAVKVAPLGDQR